MRNLTITALVLGCGHAPRRGICRGDLPGPQCEPDAPHLPDAGDAGRNRLSLRTAPGRTFRQTLATTSTASRPARPRWPGAAPFEIRAGLIYELIETSSGALRLRTVQP